MKLWLDLKVNKEVQRERETELVESSEEQQMRQQESRVTAFFFFALVHRFLGSVTCDWSDHDSEKIQVPEVVEYPLGENKDNEAKKKWSLSLLLLSAQRTETKERERK